MCVGDEWLFVFPLDLNFCIDLISKILRLRYAGVCMPAKVFKV